MPGILGYKLRKAREDMGLTQAKLAKAVNLSSEFISLLEIGKRMPSLDSLTALSRFFKKNASYFLEEKEENKFQFLFQKEELSKKAITELKKFQKICKEYLYLEEVTGSRLEPAPYYRNISPQRMAREERQRIGLGDEPIRNIYPILEHNGLHIIKQPVPEELNISGIFIYFETEESAFSLINSAQPPDLQIFTAAHQYCHYLKDRFGDPIIDNPDVLIDEYLPLYHPREKFAQTFANRFLIPPSKVKEIIEKNFHLKQLTLKEVLYLKRYFGVGMNALLYMLAELEYLSPSKLKEYQKLDFAHYEKALFSRSEDGATPKKMSRKKTISDRFIWLALEAYRKKKINVHRLKEILKLGKDNGIPKLMI